MGTYQRWYYICRGVLGGISGEYKGWDWGTPAWVTYQWEECAPTHGFWGRMGVSRGGWLLTWWWGRASWVLLKMKCWSVLQYLVPDMWKLEFSQISIEWRVIHPNVHGLLDVPGHALSLPVHYGDAIWADWVSCGSVVKVDGWWCCKMFLVSVPNGPTRFPYVFLYAVYLWALLFVDNPTFL